MFIKAGKSTLINLDNVVSIAEVDGQPSLYEFSFVGGDAWRYSVESAEIDRIL